jgi:hypothetical protein
MAQPTTQSTTPAATKQYRARHQICLPHPDHIEARAKADYKSKDYEGDRVIHHPPNSTLKLTDDVAKPLVAAGHLELIDF